MERRRIDFQNAQSSKQVLRREEDVVIVNLVVFAEDPALRTRVSLRRASFDQISQRVLTLVGKRQVRVVEHDHDRGQRHSCEQQWHRQAVQAHAACFDRHDFVALAHDSQSDQNGHQRPERGQLIHQVRGQITEILHHDQEGNTVARNVIQQFEERERFEQKDKRAHQQREV